MGRALYVDVDCDLHSSTVVALEWLLANGLVRVGTLLAMVRARIWSTLEDEPTFCGLAGWLAMVLQCVCVRWRAYGLPRRI